MTERTIEDRAGEAVRRWRLRMREQGRLPQCLQQVRRRGVKFIGPRVSCVVPFCKRTISAEKYGDDVEFICRQHLKFVSRETRERKRQIDRRIRKLTRLFDKGVRRSDVVLFGKQHVQRGIIQIDGKDAECEWLHFTTFKRRNKKPITLDIPILPVLQEVIDASPIGDLTFIINEYGRPFTAASFGNRMRKWCDAAGIPDCSSHGLRKAGATRAAENGASEYTLMAMFGWMTPKEAARYTRAVRQKRLAAAGMPLLIGR